VVISTESEATTAARVVNCGGVSADNAMPTTLARQSCSIWRLEMLPLEYANTMICSRSAGSYAVCRRRLLGPQPGSPWLPPASLWTHGSRHFFFPCVPLPVSHPLLNDPIRLEQH
jgi:hypothetical protein